MDIKYRTDFDHKLIMEVTPNKGDQLFKQALMSEIISGIAEKYIEKFYPEIESIIDDKLIKDKISLAIVDLGLKNLRGLK